MLKYRKSKISFLFFIICFCAQYTIGQIHIWTVDSKENTHTSYLFGTFHQMGEAYFDSIFYLNQVFQKIEVLVVESADTGKALKNMILSREEDYSYENYLSKITIDSLESFVKQYPLSKLKPHELLHSLQQQFYLRHCNTLNDSSKWSSFDGYLQQIAEKNHKIILGLETDSMQLSYLEQANYNVNWENSKQSIHYWLGTYFKGQDKKTLCQLFDNYKKSPLQSFELEKKCTQNVLLYQRNRQWIKQLPSLLNNNSCLIAVGQRHLKYDCGLINQLRELGYKVKPVVKTSNSLPIKILIDQP